MIDVEAVVSRDLLRRSNSSGEVTAARDSNPFNEVLLETGVVRPGC